MVQSELPHVSDNPYCLPGTIIFHINPVEFSYYNTAINRVGTVRSVRSTLRDTLDKLRSGPDNGDDLHNKAIMGKFLIGR